MPQFVASIAIFVVAYVAIASERFPRQAVALLGGVTLVVINVFDLKEAFGFVDWETMGLLFGMFILIEILKEAGFFGWLAATLARRLNYQPTAIFIAFPLMAGLLSGLMDSITVMLFLSALSVRLAKLIGIDPVPLIVAEVCAANTGGAATLVGDPPNVILGTLLGFNFNDFVLNTGPIALVALLITVGIFYAANRPMLKAAHASGSAPLFAMGLGHGIENMTMLRVGLVGFGVAIGLLVTHSYLPKDFPVHFGTATAALVPALVAVVVGGKHTRESIGKIDVESLLFFIGLFIMVGALEKTHVIGMLADGIGRIGLGNPPVLLMMLLWGPGLASGIVDNIPMALAMAYVLKDLTLMAAAPALSIMTWALAVGIDIGGNLTPVGASANVVAYTFMERNVGKVGWGRWIRMAAVPTVVSMAACSALILLKYAIGFY